MNQVPELGSITQKIVAIIQESVDPEEPVKTGASLMKEQGFDSLDLIETSFSLQEFFDFEFSDKNAVEELEKALGQNTIINEGLLTDLGRQMVLERMPELKNLSLPESLSPMELQQYYTVETFARLIQEFYLEAPKTCPDTGEAVILDDFKLVTKESRTPVKMPTGDSLVEQWVARTAAKLKAS